MLVLRKILRTYQKNDLLPHDMYECISKCKEYDFSQKTCFKYFQKVENTYKSGGIYEKKTELKEIKSCTGSQLDSCWKSMLREKEIRDAK